MQILSQCPINFDDTQVYKVSAVELYITKIMFGVVYFQYQVHV